MYKSIIITDEEKCMGCNKCVLECPVNANNAKIMDGKNKISIDSTRCIQCGECIHICDHNARQYEDDTEEFLNHLKRGDKISILVAPAIRHNFSDYTKVLGFLKQLGVNLIYDVSFGADITTWAYIKAIKENQITTCISQPCPVIVSYIQHYKTELIPYLAPIHSPAMCAAVYLKKYKSVAADLAFISPCIGKIMEFTDDNTHSLISYNVTFAKLKQYIKDNNINLANYPGVDFDDRPCDLGFTFSRPGGLRENVEYYCGSQVWVKQVEGIGEVCRYLDEYGNRIQKRKPTPLLVDVLNCKHGCNLGTATDNEADIDDVDYKTNQLKNQFLDSKPNPEESQLFKVFEENLSLNDFVRQYADYSQNIVNASNDEIEAVFMQLGKETLESRNINCFSCGYGACLKFATAIANGNNDVRNCINYSRMKLQNGKDEFDDLFHVLQDHLLQMNSKLKSVQSSATDLNNIAMQTKVISINASIESAHAGQYGKGFSIVASEIKSLANKSGEIIESNQDKQESLFKDIEAFEKFINNIKEKIDDALEL